MGSCTRRYVEGMASTARWCRRRPLAAALAVAAITAPLPGVSAQRAGAVQCAPDGALVRVAALPEGSGVAASRRMPGRVWALNDSGEPVVFLLDRNGQMLGRVRLAGATVTDWEALAVGPCPGGTCLFAADIGDNDGRRTRITVYRAPEPAAVSGTTTLPAEAFHATYPDRPQDAETLLVAPDGRLHIVTKGDTGPVALYRFPADLRAGATSRLERVGEPRERRQPPRRDRITDGTVSPDGTWVALRSTEAIVWHRAAELFAGRWQTAARVDIRSLKEPQGEGVTFVSDDELVLVGEDEKKSRPGTFARLSCTLSGS